MSEEIESLLTHRGRPGTLAQSYAALTHTTRTLRDLISDDIWPVIARMNQRLRSLGGQDVQPVEQRLTDIVDGCLTLSGAVADSMPRNLGWDLTEAGRKIERTMSLLALLRGPSVTGAPARPRPGSPVRSRWSPRAAPPTDAPITPRSSRSCCWSCC